MIYLKRIIQEIKLYEGLDMTHSRATTIGMLKTWGKYRDRKSEIIPYVEGEDKVIISIKNSSKDEFDNIIRLINNMGWFPSVYYLENQPKKYDYNTFIKLIESNYELLLEIKAKFDIQVDSDTIDSIDELYHISPTVNEDKILKIGLAPKNKEKIATHPSRIYFAFDYKDAEFLAKDRNFNQGKKHMTIFKVDMIELNKRRLIRFFKDPDFEGGIYTYENIPPQFISVEKRIEV